MSEVLYYFKLSIAFLETWLNELDADSFKALFWDILDYVKTGEERKVPKSYSWAYNTFLPQLKGARIKADKLHAARVEAGRAGGQAKARNAKAAQEPTTAADSPAAGPLQEKPWGTVHPSKKEVQSIFRELKKEGKITQSVTMQDANDFYAEMEAQGWNIDGVPIHEKRVLRKVMFFRYNSFFASRGSTAEQLRIYFALVEALGGQDPESCSLSGWGGFVLNAYDKSTNTWTVGGTTYSTLDEAADAFVASHGKA